MQAAGRGRWDRASTEDERRHVARGRIVSAAAEAIAAHGRAVTAAEIIELAGVGRNTFYEHFDSVAAVVHEVARAAADETLAAVKAATLPARTPRERLRALASAWLGEAARRPVATLALLASDPDAEVKMEAANDGATASRSLLKSMEHELRAALELGRAAGVVSRPGDPFRVACALGAFTAAARFVAGSSETDVAACAETLADLTLRVFR